MLKQTRASIRRHRTQNAERIVRIFIMSVCWLFSIAILATLAVYKEFFAIAWIICIFIAANLFKKDEKRYGWLLAISVFWPILWAVLINIF